MSLPNALEDDFNSNQCTTEALPPIPSRSINSQEAYPLHDLPKADDSSNRTQSSTSSIDAAATEKEQFPQSIEGNDLASPYTHRFGNASRPHMVAASRSTSQDGPAEVFSTSSPDGIPGGRTSDAVGDDDKCVESDCELCHISNESSPHRRDCTANLSYGDDHVATVPCTIFDDDLRGPRIDGKIGQHEEATSDIESQPENVW
ncbi:hypothetical protein H9L39_18947 [Fusarium oxysporum f. sp. albedinis]|nr:hypothetical protein H9L39_18947 [Fusarium oxysporum f. sp. albedinis]